MYVHLVFSPLILGPGQERPLYVSVLSHGCLGPHPLPWLSRWQMMPAELTLLPAVSGFFLLSPFSS